MACKGCSIRRPLPHQPQQKGGVQVTSSGRSAGPQVEQDDGRGHKSQRSSLAPTYTLTNTSHKTNEPSPGRANDQGLFFYTHTHVHTNTTSNSQRLIEVSAPLIVFVHLGMKEPF